MLHVEKPASIGLPAFLRQIEGLFKSVISAQSGCAKIVERPQHVVVP